MPHQRYDIGSKWLLHHQGKGVLFVGGLKDIRRYEPMPGEIVQNRRYPDGLLRVYFEDEPEPDHVLVEVATYPEKRALKQAMDDLTLAYSALGHLPELLMLVLHPKGRFRIAGRSETRSKRGLSNLTAQWKVVELWNLLAEEFLAEGHVGVVPWVPLMRFEGPPKRLLERCAARIDSEASGRDRDNLRVVSQVMTKLRFPDTSLLTIFGGRKAMIESPLIQQWKAEAVQEDILEILRDHFKSVPRDVTKQLRKIIDEKRLRKLVVIAANCSDLEGFREALSS
jgi:hypothetical protein